MDCFVEKRKALDKIESDKRAQQVSWRSRTLKKEHNNKEHNNKDHNNKEHNNKEMNNLIKN